MKSSVIRWDTDTREWGADTGMPALEDVSLALFFGDRLVLEESSASITALQGKFPKALVAGCSTSGEIYGGEVLTGGVIAILMTFDTSTVSHALVELDGAGSSRDVGERLAGELLRDDLCGVFIFSDGTLLDGNALLEGILGVLPEGVALCGGMAGDGDRFKSTLVGLGSDLRPGRVLAIGFHGKDIEIVCGSAGGWEPFGPFRRITKSNSNVLNELDGEPALGLYKRYLGDRAANLPAGALYFPLAIYTKGPDEQGVTRTILAVDEAEQTMTFAGNIPEEFPARLMHAGSERLIQGAQTAAERARGDQKTNADAAVLFSCVGRRLILGQRAEDEVSEVLNTIGPGVPAAGCYSYGSLAPFFPGGKSELHNQTMTVALFREHGRE